MRDVRYFNLVCSLTESGESGFSTTYCRYPKKNMYKYGMRLRGFSIGCQPMNGLEEWQDTDGKYYSELTYSRKLSTGECEQYDLDYIGEI